MNFTVDSENIIETLKKEVEQLKAEAEKEEKELLEKIQQGVTAIEKANNVFIGVILTKGDILNVLSIALDTKESIRIPARIYFNDNE